MNPKAGVQTNFVDRPEVSETFADSLQSLHFDGQSIKILLCTTRFDSPKPKKAPAATRYPACRLVLTPSAALDLFSKMQRMVKALEEKGVIKKETPPPQTIQ